MKEIEKIIEILDSIIKKTEPSDRQAFFHLTSETNSVLERFYSTKSSYHQDLQYVRKTVSILVGLKKDNVMGRDLNESKKFFLNLLNSIKNELSIIGLPTSSDIKIDKSVNVNVSQNQSQEQSQVSEFFIDLIKDEITGKQLKEVKEILQSETDSEKVKQSLLKKIGTFSGNVAASIVANILTNPSIWTGLIK